MSEINPSHLHQNGPAEVRLKINLWKPLWEAGPGGCYCTRMELEPHTASHQRNSAKEENATLSTKSSEQKLPLSKRICPTSRYVTALEQPQDAFDDAEPHPPPKSSGDVQKAIPGGVPAATWDAQATLPLSRQYLAKG